MIRIIGIKRLVILLVLIGTNAFLASVIYMYVLPEKEKTDQDLTMLRGQLSSVEGDIAKMQVEFAQLEERQALFDKLKAHGYFSTQDRGDAKQLFSDIQEKANVVSAVVSVKSGVIEENAEAQKANHKVLMSPIDIQIKAFDDGDIYRYINLIEKMFPGHVSLDGITMKRSRDVTAALLRAIANGASPELVTADIRMSWRTMIPEDQVILDTGLKR
tara:strand:- start:2476 stop:3123 length:648 start_codon:yes stop_codon:yes gene_type:complete